MKIVKAGYTELPMGIPTPENVMKHIERCGRVCYKSEDKITPGSSEKFCASIIKRGHTSVLEHANLIFRLDQNSYDWWWNQLKYLEHSDFRHYLRITSEDDDSYIISGNVRAWREVMSIIVSWYAGYGGAFPLAVIDAFSPMGILFSDILRYIENGYVYDIAGMKMNLVTDNCPISQAGLIAHGTATIKFTVDRGISHEIVRHRTASFSQESTRYCNYGKGQFNGEITVVEPNFFSPGTTCYGLWEYACKRAESMYFSLLNEGCSPQQARDVLPTSTKTEIVMTDTYDHWRHFLELRTSPAAHPQIRELAVPLLNDFKQKFPLFFDISL